MLKNRYAVLWIMLAIASLVLGILPTYPVMAQDGGEDDDPIDILIDISGTVQEINLEAGTLVIDGVTVSFDPALIESLEIEVGTVITVSGELLDDGTIVAAEIVVGDANDDEDNVSECGYVPKDEADGNETTEDPSEDPASTDETTLPPYGDCHPVLESISLALEVPYDELETLFTEGYGVGEVARAYLIAEGTDEDIETIVALRESGLGWGEILQQYPDVHPSDLAPGALIGNGRGRTIQEEYQARNSEEDYRGGRPDLDERGNCRNNDGQCDGNGHPDDAGQGNSGGNGNNGNGNGQGNGNSGNGNGGGNGGGRPR
jgi:hypothetical protein